LVKLSFLFLWAFGFVVPKVKKIKAKIELQVLFSRSATVAFSIKVLVRDWKVAVGIRSIPTRLKALASTVGFSLTS
jgi:hypothetical protein